MPRKTTKERLQQRLANKNETAKPPAVPAPARPVPLAETKPIEPDLALSTSPYAWLGSDGPRQYEKFFKPNDRLTKAYEQALTTFIDVGTRHALEPMRVIRAYFDLEHACYLYTKECAKKLNLANSSNPTVQSLRRFFQDDLAVQFNESVPMTFFDVGNKYLTAGALLHSALFSYLRSLSNIGILAELYKPVFYEHLAEANRKNLLPGLIENHKNLIKRLGLDFPSFFESERQEVIQNVVSTLYQCIKERLEQMAVGEVVGLTELLKIVRTMLDETSIRAYMLSETHLANDALIKLFELTTRHQALGEFYPFVVDLLSNLAALASPEGSLNAELETTIGQMKIVIKQLADYPPHFLAAENLLAIMQQFNTSFAPSIYAECQRYVELKRAELPAATGYLAIQKLREVLDGLRRFYREQPGSSFTAAASKFIVWMEKFSTELQTNVPEALQLINDAAALIVELFGAEPRAKLFSKIMAAYLFWWLLKAKTIEPQQKADIWQHFNRVAADYAKINQEEMQPEQKKIAAEETNRIMDFLRGELMKQLDSCLDSGQPDSELEAVQIINAMRNFFKHEPLPVRSLLKFAQSSLAVDNIVTAMSAIIGALDLMVGNTFKPKQRKSIAEQLQNVRIELLAKLKAGDQEALRKDPVLKPLFQSLCAKLSSDDEVKKLLEAWLAPEDLARAVETTTSEEGASSGASSAHQSPSLAACDTGAILAGLASGPASKPDHSPVPKSSEERAVSKCMPLFRPKYYFTQTPMPATFFFGSAFIAPFPEIPDPLRPGQFLGGSRDGGTPFQKPLDPNAPVFVPGKRV